MTMTSKADGSHLKTVSLKTGQFFFFYNKLKTSTYKKLKTASTSPIVPLTSKGNLRGYDK